MKHFLSNWTMIILAAIFLVVLQTNIGHGKTDPVLNNGKKWRIAYYEGGAYSNYQLTLVSTIQGLVKLGWIDSVDFPKNLDESSNRPTWNHLSHHIKSKYLEFVNDGFLSADWISEKRAKNKDKFIYRLSKKRDIDLVFAMGTWAGADLANNQHSTPTIVMSTSDPVRAKIIKSPQDSGYDHVFARCDPKRYERQIRLFHRIVRFKNLGMIIENSDDGRLHSAWKDVVKVSKERNFEITPCYVQDVEIEANESIKQCLQCLKKIAPKIDGFWLTGLQGTQAKFIHNYIPILIEYKIPSWSLVQNPKLIKRGILMAFTKKDFSRVGMFQAETIAKILNGAKPRNLNQVFEDMDTIAVNTKTAELINYSIPHSILRISDIKYDEIETK